MTPRRRLSEELCLDFFFFFVVVVAAARSWPDRSAYRGASIVLSSSSSALLSGDMRDVSACELLGTCGGRSRAAQGDHQAMTASLCWGKQRRGEITGVRQHDTLRGVRDAQERASLLASDGCPPICSRSVLDAVRERILTRGGPTADVSALAHECQPQREEAWEVVGSQREEAASGGGVLFFTLRPPQEVVQVAHLEYRGHGSGRHMKEGHIGPRTVYARADPELDRCPSDWTPNALTKRADTDC